MPDLMIVHARVCASARHWEKKVAGSHGETYTVRYGEVYGKPYSHGWTCTCPSFKFRGPCKHILRVQGERCAWGEGAFMGDFEEANADGSCPKCGGETFVIRVGV